MSTPPRSPTSHACFFVCACVCACVQGSACGSPCPLRGLQRRARARPPHLWLQGDAAGSSSPSTPTASRDDPVRQLLRMAAATAAAANAPSTAASTPVPAPAPASRQQASSVAMERGASGSCVGVRACFAKQLAARLPQPGTPVEVSEIMGPAPAGEKAGKASRAASTHKHQSPSPAGLGRMDVASRQRPGGRHTGGGGGGSPICATDMALFNALAVSSRVGMEGEGKTAAGMAGASVACPPGCSQQVGG